jgi:hypothetical protein
MQYSVYGHKIMYFWLDCLISKIVMQNMFLNDSQSFEIAMHDSKLRFFQTSNGNIMRPLIPKTTNCSDFGR